MKKLYDVRPARFKEINIFKMADDSRLDIFLCLVVIVIHSLHITSPSPAVMSSQVGFPQVTGGIVLLIMSGGDYLGKDS